MAEWLYEEGIGENRAILVEDGAILEAAIELPGLRLGAVLPARLGGPGIALLADGTEAQVEAPGLTEGAAFRAEIVREAIPERGRSKPVRVRPTDLPLRAGSSLSERIGDPPAGFGPDRFEEAGWSRSPFPAAAESSPPTRAR